MIDADLLPVHAGMFPRRKESQHDAHAAPRARGDVPIHRRPPYPLEPCSPCTRGCSRRTRPGHDVRELLPVHAGMFPTPRSGNRPYGSAPRARGGVPYGETVDEFKSDCSPCTRGCSRVSRGSGGRCGLLPVHAGMFTSRRPRSTAESSHSPERSDRHNSHARSGHFSKILLRTHRGRPWSPTRLQLTALEATRSRPTARLSAGRNMSPRRRSSSRSGTAPDQRNNMKRPR